MALNKTKDRSLMEQLGARGSLQDLMEKGPLFRRGSHCGGMYVINNRSQYRKIYPQALHIVVWEDFPAAAAIGSALE